MKLPSPIRSKVPSKEFKDNYDKIFGKKDFPISEEIRHASKSQIKRLEAQKKKEPK